MQAPNDMGGLEGEEPLDSTARYIASLADELALLARRDGLDTLSYLLEMARLEADHAAGKALD